MVTVGSRRQSPKGADSVTLGMVALGSTGAKSVARIQALNTSGVPTTKGAAAARELIS